MNDGPKLTLAVSDLEDATLRRVKQLGVDHVISLIRPDNAKSIRVAEKIGERYDRKIDLFGTPVSVYRVNRDTWRR